MSQNAPSIQTISRTFSRFVCPAILLASVACSNPADNATEAVVEQAAPAPVVAVEATELALSEGTRVGFEGSKVTGSHVGGFEVVSGTVSLVNQDPTQSQIAIEIDMTSTWSDSDRLTGHLESPDFFDVETHPIATFNSTSIVASEEGYAVTGNLMLRGTEKSITFPATIAVNEGQVTANAEFFINRFDFGIEYPGKVDDLIRDEVVIRLDLVAGPTA